MSALGFAPAVWAPVSAPCVHRLSRVNRWVGSGLLVAALVGCAPSTPVPTASSDEAARWASAALRQAEQTQREQAQATADLQRMAPPTTPMHQLPDPLHALERAASELRQHTPSEPEAMPQVDQKGMASWYGPGFHGRRTANGERFDMGELTAAHPNYAFGTRLCVRSSVTGKTVVVRVNDRGPYAKNRVIDLSKAAAQELGMIGLGIKPVEIFKLPKGEDECPDAVLEARN